MAVDTVINLNEIQELEENGETFDSLSNIDDTQFSPTDTLKSEQ